MKENFFIEQKEQSAIKTAIVANFYSSYLIIINSIANRFNCFYYIDLFSGPGIYENGIKSTPLIILDIIEKNKLYDKVFCIFNEMELKLFIQLKNNIQKHPIYSKLKNKPILYNLEAKDVPIDNFLVSNCPTFSFIDPFGYKDISAEQIWKLVNNIGSDCILFFNANRLLLDLNKQSSIKHMKLLFGDRLEILKKNILEQYSHALKIKTILKEFCRNLYENKKISLSFFTLPFKFDFADKQKSSHYLIFITKSYKAIEVMKDIMNKFSNYIGNELGFNPKTIGQLAFDFDENSLELKIIIHNFIKIFNKYNEEYTIKEIMREIDNWYMSQHFSVTPFSLRNYKQCIRNMFDNNDKVKILDYNTFRKNEIFSEKRKFYFFQK